MTAPAGGAATPVGANSSGVDPSSGGFGIGAATGLASGVAGIYGGVKQGGAVGDARAAVGAAQLGARTNAFGADSSAVGNYVGGANNVLGIYSGLKQGGVAGDAGAAVNAAQLGSRVGAFGGYSGAIGSAAGYAAAPLAVYNAVNNWKSGATGSDALNGAEAGAAVGSIVPGVGTIIGGLVGGAVGAVSSIFGNGEVDPENAGFEQYTHAYNSAKTPQQQAAVASSNQDPYLTLAGLFDLRSNQIKGSIPIYNKYGRMGEQTFTTDMTSQINNALKAGTIQRTDSPQTIYQKVVDPWISSMGSWSDSNKGAIQAALQQMVGQYVAGKAQTQWKAQGGDDPFSKLPAFGS